MSKKYLFFDIESIDRRSKFIATFGYVLVDSNFNVLVKEDILINPDVEEYDWYVLKNIFHYTREDAVNSPKFSYFYDKINELLTDSNIVNMGYAIINDLDYLRNDYHRMGREYNNLEGYDVQVFYKKLNNLENGMKLFNLARTFGIDVTGYIEHKSDDDAMVSMLITKHYCEKFNLSIDEFVNKFEISVRPTKLKM